jgi:hypothetical protein
MSERQSYYSDFLPSFYAGILGNIVGVFATQLSNGRFSLALTIITMIAVLPLTAIFIAILIRLFPVYIDRQGVKSYNFWGVYRYLRWDEITSAKPFIIFNLSYIQIRSIDNKQIFIPLFLSKMSSFNRQVRAFVDLEHPIVRFLK